MTSPKLAIRTGPADTRGKLCDTGAAGPFRENSTPKIEGKVEPASVSQEGKMKKRGGTPG